MTPSRGSYPDVSSPATATAPHGGTQARQFTEPLRELCVAALLAGNAVFLFLGFSGLFLVIERWATDFGLRCAQVFSTFVGPISLGLPVAALLLATHVAPMVARARLIMIVVLSELGVSAVFGALTFLGAFAHDLSSPRATIEGTLWRLTWLGFLVLAGVVTVRLWLGLYPPPKPAAPIAGYAPYAQPAYGRPYPGQPLYPQQPYPAGAAQDATPATGWPLVPPPPMPAPLVVPRAEQTVRVSPETIELSGDLTQLVPVAGDVTQLVPQQGDRTQRMSPPVEPPTQEVAWPPDATPIPVTAVPATPEQAQDATAAAEEAEAEAPAADKTAPDKAAADEAEADEAEADKAAANKTEASDVAEEDTTHEPEPVVRSGPSVASEGSVNGSASPQVDR